jgi:type II secretory pathway pseudopilin PulG
MKLKMLEISSMIGALTSIGTAVTLDRAGVVFGIITGLTTCALNVFYMLRKDAREQRQAELAIREAEARLAALGMVAKSAPDSVPRLNPHPNYDDMA